MLLLTSTSDKIQVVTGSAIAMEIHQKDIWTK